MINLIMNILTGSYGRNMAIAAVFAMCLSGCKPGFENIGSGDDDDDDDSSSIHYISTGSGSAWLLEIDDDSFDLKLRPSPSRSATTLVSGEYEDLTSGYSRLTVDIASGDNQPAEETQMSALVLNEHLLLLDDWLNAGRLMPFIPDDDCPEPDFSANWIQLISPTGGLANDAGTAFFGELSYSVDAEAVSLSSRHALTEGYPELASVDALETGGCDGGYSSEGGNTVFFADNGSALVHQTGGDAGESLLLALPSTLLTNADLDGSYLGFWTDDTRSANEQLWTVTMECTDGSCPVNRITDITDLNSTANQGFQIGLDTDAPDEPRQGFITGTVSSGVGAFVEAGSLACIASDDFNDSGAKLLVCVGQAPSNPQFMVNGFFIAQD